jgi:hypothetical protein
MKLYDDYRKLSYFISGVGYLGDYFIIMTEKHFIPSYNPLDVFLKINNITNINKNIMILPKNLRDYFKKLLDVAYEISGAIDYNTLFINNNITWKYLYHYSKVKQGNTDSADFSIDKITFHTHPISNYEKLKIKIAWPSVQDYITICHIIKNQQIPTYHITITKEGLYITIYSLYHKNDEEWIKKYMDIPYCINNISKFIRGININPRIQTIFKKWDDIDLQYNLII